jgi:glycosyltransferase involved in cell wall biosynthesis
MLGPATCVVVIPCFNEGTSIGSLVNSVRRSLPSVFVVDDGSVDDTAAAAKTAGAMVLAHDRNLGKGAALKTGLSRALQQGFEWAVTLDGDGQHSADDLSVLLRCAEATRATLVIGNRMHDPSKMSWLRRNVNSWMSRKISRRMGRELPDTQCGFRIVHLRTWASLPLTTERFEVESEMLTAFLAARLQVAFAPIRVINSKRASHIHPFRDAWRWLTWWRGVEWPTLPDQSKETGWHWRNDRPVQLANREAA